MHDCILARMYRMLLALSLATLVTFSVAQAPQSPRSAVLATVNQFVDSFNKGDLKTLLAACADQTSIIDEFPPHEWHGAGACAKWVSDFDVDAKKNGITDGFVTLSKPSHVDVTGDRAYVVIPATYSFRQNEKPVSEVGSIITLTLQKSSSDWRITGCHGRSIRGRLALRILRPFPVYTETFSAPLRQSSIWRQKGPTYGFRSS